MSDVQGSADSTPPPSPVEQNIPDPIEGNSDAERVRESVKAINEQRARAGTAVEVDRAPVRIRYPHRGRDEEPETYKDAEPKKLRQVAADTADFHRTEDAEFQHMVRLGANPSELLARIKDPEQIRELTGWTVAEAREYARTGQMPPVPIGVIDEKKRLQAATRS
jgi:hypothetical protein